MEKSDSVGQQNPSAMRGMTHSQESRVSSSQDSRRLTEASSISSVTALVNKLTSCAGDEGTLKISPTSNQEDMTIETIFPWLRSFGDLCRSSVGSKNVKVLENLLTVYLQHVSIDVKNCYLKPNRAAKLKKCMNEALLFFHMFYQDVREPMEHLFYLSKMTDLLSMYMDMEIIASRRKKETTKKVVSRLTSSLYIFLDHSEQHMLDAILKAKLFTKMNKEICTPILRKLMLSIRITTVYELLYVRCILVFKLWKKLVKDAEEKKMVTNLALQRLSVSTDFPEKLKAFADVLPRIPKTKKNITLFYMQAKINLKIANKAFLQVCKDSQALGDKHMFYGEHLEEPIISSVGDKTVDVGGERTGNYLNNIWSSLSVDESSELKALGGDKEKVDVLSGKKQKSQEKNGKKVKNKCKADKKSARNLEETNKKKKKQKNKLGSGEAISVLDGISAITGKEVKKKKKKAQLHEESEITIESIGKAQNAQVKQVSSELVVVKTEESAQDANSGSTEVTKEIEIEKQGLNQVNEINSVGCANEDASVQLIENVEVNQPASVTVPAVVEASRVCVATDASEQINLINSVCNESQNTVSQLVEPANSSSSTASVSQTLNESEVVQVDDTKAPDDSILAPLNSENTVLTSIADATRVDGESVIVPSSSSNSLVECLVDTSHKPQQTAIVENEAVPSIVAQAVQDASSTGMVAPKLVSYLVPTQICDDSGVTNIVPSREVVLNACDSSIKLEDSIQGGGSVTVVNSVPIPNEGCGGVDNDYFNRICPIEYDSDAEILSDLRQHRTIPEEERELVLVRNERDLLPRDSVQSNIFATENSDLLIEALGDVVLPVSSMDLDSRVLCSEDGTMESPLLCAGEEGTQLESPPIDPMNENEKRSLEYMISNIRSNKDTGLFAQFGTERQDWLHHGSDKFLSYGNCDYMFSSNPSPYTSVMPVRENALATSSFMDEDDDEDVYGKDDGYERDMSSDEEGESLYEYHSSSPSSSPRMKMGGGKVGLHNFSLAVNEKDVLNSSSSNISDSPPTLKNAYVSSGSPFKKTSTVSRDILDKPRIGEKTPAPLSVSSARTSPLTTLTTSVVSSTPISTLKNLNVNLTKCTDVNVVNNPKKTNRTPRNQSNRTTNRSVARDACSVTENSGKGTAARMGQQKKQQGTIPSGTVTAKKRGRPRTKNLTPPPTRQSKRQGVKRKPAASTKRRAQEDDDPDDAVETPPKRKKSERNRQTRKTNTTTASTITNVPHTRIKSRQGFVLENIELQNSNTSSRRKR